jgi:hypothetical protein
VEDPGLSVRRVLNWAACLSPLLGLLAGCGMPLASPDCGELPCDSQRSVTRTFHTSATPSLDLLVVVDDTSAIAPYAAMVTTTLSAFATELTLVRGREPSLQVRFVSATLGSPGCPVASRAAACGIGADETLRAGLCGSDPSFAGGLSDAFACLGDRGANGCGPLQPLEAARSALAAAGDFLRPDAYLAIIVVAGADDASMSPVDTYVDFIKSLKVDPANQLFASVIAPATPACSDAATGEPVRLGAFARAFGRNGVLQSVCASSWLQALAPLVQGAQHTVEPYCLQGLRDTDAAREGMQAHCTVTEVTWDHYPDDPQVAQLPSCDGAPPPCWRMEGFSACRGGWRGTIDHGTDWCPLVATETTYECLGCLNPNDPACAAP